MTNRLIIIAPAVALIGVALGGLLGFTVADDDSPQETPRPTWTVFMRTVEPTFTAPFYVEVTDTPTPTPMLTEAPTHEPPQAPTDPPVIVQEAPQEVLPAYAPGSLEAIVCSMPWPCQEALRVAACESGTDMNGNLDGAYATNYWTATPAEGDGVFGLFQIALPLHADLMAMYGTWEDPVANTHAAYDLWAGSGGSWRPHWAWDCQPY